MKTAYPVFIKKKDGEQLVFVPDFEIYTEGNDYADAIHMARDAIGLRLMIMEDEGLNFPVPSSYKSAIELAKKDADDEMDYSDGILTLVDIDVSEYRRKNDMRTVKKNCTIPSWLNELAIERGINFSAALQEALKQKLGV